MNVVLARGAGSVETGPDEGLLGFVQRVRLVLRRRGGRKEAYAVGVEDVGP